MNNDTEQIFLINSNGVQHTIESQKSTVTTTNNLQNVLVSDNMCRTCASVTEFIIPIFHGEGLQNNLAEKIHKHLPIQVLQDDDLPQAVCYQCASTLLAWHELVECCVQADAALRTRRAVTTSTILPLVQDVKPGPSTNTFNTAGQSNIEKEKEPQNKFEEYVVVEVEAPPPPPRITCTYCSAQHEGAPAHEEHLVAAHSDLLFHCDECHQYVARKDLILHMSVHAVQYTISTERPTEHTDNKTVTVEDPHNGKVNNEDPQPESEQTAKDTGQDSISRSPALDKDEEVSTSVGENEFSDHTDTEDGFGPLPESVFEAIEDSQDSHDKPTTPQKENKKKKDKVRTCPICFKVYVASSSYFYHMKYFHRGSREHQCEVCSRRFGTRAVLSQHALTHTEDLQYPCTTCDKRFRSKASLYIHSQLHVGKKEFKCSACGRCFAWRQLLLRHMKRHAAEKSHACGVCGRGFSIRSDLSRHLRTHNAGCHACDKCGAKFAQLRYLKVHMDKKHTAICSETVSSLAA